MEIAIRIEHKTIEITLIDKKKIIDEISLADERDLGERLLIIVDELMVRNKTTIRSIQKVKVKSDQGDSFTTTRLAKAFAKTVNWSNARG